MDLNVKAVTAIERIPDVQPAITFEELDAIPKLVRANPEWQAAIRKRGITTFEDVMVDPWAPGPLDPKTEPASMRWARALAYLKGTQKNGYARPIERVVAVVNLTEMRVERVMDLGAMPVPPHAADLDPASVGALRATPKPLQHAQPLGPGFTMAGHEVRWQKWRSGRRCIRAKAWSSTPSGTRTVDASDQSSTAPRCRKCSCPTRTPRATGRFETPSTKVSTD